MALRDVLIGRAAERAVLVAHADRVIAGRGSIVLVSGEAGVGKTTLVRRVLEELGLDRLEGFGVKEGAMAYGPVVGALRMLRHERPDAWTGADTSLGVLLPELGAARRALEAADLFEGIRSAFAAGAAQAPLAVVFDDMQWADEATLGLLPAMARALDSEPVLLVVVYREDEVPRGHPIRRLRTELRRDERLTEVPLQPLAGADVAGLLGQALNGTPAPSLVGAVLAHTGGVPLFVTELGAALRAGARLREGDAGLELSQGADLPLPESVRDAVLVRASGVAPDARSLLEVAAVLGNTFEVDLAMAIARVDTWPDDLLDHGLVAEAAPGSMTFRHALVREVRWLASKKSTHELARMRPKTSSSGPLGRSTESCGFAKMHR